MNEEKKLDDTPEEEPKAKKELSEEEMKDTAGGATAIEYGLIAALKDKNPKRKKEEK